MARRLATPTTALGVAIRARRGDRSQVSAAAEIGIEQTALSRAERGTHEPSIDTALALARWLAWPVEQVLVAARTPLDHSSSGG